MYSLYEIIQTRILLIIIWYRQYSNIRNHLFAVDNIRPNMIVLFDEKETSISDRQNQNNILSVFYKMPT